jgi:type I restriction enzyme S subunit
VIGYTSEANADAGSIVIGRVGSYCGSLFLSNQKCWVTDNAIRAAALDDNDPRFLFYLLSTLKLNNWRAGSGQPLLNQEILSRIPTAIPEPPEQRAIAHILGTLDDKIELNRQMSETLEAMAKALFKSWFVDFDPVRAKCRDTPLCPPTDWDGPSPQKGQAQGPAPTQWSQHILDLFPERLVDSELGEMPEGWGVGTFGSITSQRTERVGSRDVVVLSAVASGKLARSDDHFTKRVYSKETHKYLLVEQWDFAYNPSRINIGSIGMLEEDFVGGVSPVYVVARPRPAYRWLLEFSLRRSHTKVWINTLASGSVRQSLSYYDFSSIPCVLPPEHIAEEFNRKWSILRDGICARAAASDTLAALRDTLLPKLISGELRLPAALRDRAARQG